MKYVKMLGLAAIAATALMAFVGASSASATVLCTTEINANGTCPAGWSLAKGAVLEASSVGEEKPVLTSTFKTVECESSSVKGTIENAGGAASTVSGPITSLTFATPCNCTVVVSQEHTGELEVHAIGDTGNGTLTSNGTTVTINCSTIFGTVHCNYKTENDDMGTLTGSKTTKGTATMDITVEVRREPTSSLCDEEATWHVKYKVTSHETLNIATS